MLNARDSYVLSTIVSYFLVHYAVSSTILMLFAKFSFSLIFQIDYKHVFYLFVNLRVSLEVRKSSITATSSLGGSLFLKPIRTFC